MSSPKMTRMFGLLPDGAAVCAWAAADLTMLAAATAPAASAVDPEAD
ncbi:hypothetical protein K8R51_27140 [Rhizobium favelukesii]|nr:hypothetical protein [Rhizobium favelukesii]MCS0462116.1 hypothetical protein [Rhizobium favelukesii]